MSGGKFVRYDTWDCNTRIPSQDAGYVGQFEFYNYGAGNTGELKNDVVLTTALVPSPTDISGNFFAALRSSQVQAELYSVPSQFYSTACGGPWYTAFNSYQTAIQLSCGSYPCGGMPGDPINY